MCTCIIILYLITNLLQLQLVYSKCYKSPRFTLLNTRRIDTHPKDAQVEVEHMTKDYGYDGYKHDKEADTFGGDSTSATDKHNDAKTFAEASTSTSEDALEEQANREGASSTTDTQMGESNDHTSTENTSGIVVDAEKGRLKDDVPLSTMQGSSNYSNVDNKTKNVTSHHTGDTSTYVTNNFYNPPIKNDETFTSGAQLEHEYLWKRIYDIDSKLFTMEPIPANRIDESSMKRKGLVITFDPETDPNKHTLTLDSSGIPIA